MSQELWSAVDRYIVECQVGTDAALDHALALANSAGLPAINVAPNQGKFLQLLARTAGARKILEIGTLGGYSAIWLARALPAGGRLITLESQAKHVEIARSCLDKAGLSNVVDIRLGRALETLPTLKSEAPFDFTFIDADKENIAEYFRWALELSRPGALIVVDNVVRKGAVLDAESSDVNVQGVRRFNESLAKESRVTATTLQTVGSKGYDGVTIALVTA